MRYKFGLLFLIFACVAGEASGQTTTPHEKKRAVLMPMEILLPVVASQPDCPLQIENVRLIKYADGYFAGMGGEAYQLRNRGTKPICSYSIATLTTAGSGEEYTWNKLLIPGQTTMPSDEGSEVEIVALSDDLREKLKLRGTTRGVIVFMVVRVEFEDGTTYSDESTFKALNAYFEGTAVKIDRH